MTQQQSEIYWTDKKIGQALIIYSGRHNNEIQIHSRLILPGFSHVDWMCDRIFVNTASTKSFFV
ncbi:protein of unknown function [Xenorhabdus nematophila AN6/1]|nr:protein of unknown function [Xenorhabdus nematophila AN6/1]